MRNTRRLLWVVAAAVALGALPGAAAEDAADRDWSFEAYLAGYAVPDGDDFLLPVFRADRGRLHLEGRYNYEAPDTGSVWVGCSFSFGETVTFDVTPMVGGVFGDVDGIAPGYEATLGWRKLELYTEGEVVFDSADDGEDFFYTWSELSFAPTDRFRFGLVVQRTKAYETDLDIQRGLLLGATFERWDVTAYVLNPDEDPTLVVAGAFRF